MVISLSEALTAACLAYCFPSQPSPIFNNDFRSSSLPLHLWPTHHLLSFSVDDCLLLHRTNRSDRLGILSTSGQQTYNPHCSLHQYSFSYSSKKATLMCLNPIPSSILTLVFSALSVFRISFHLKKKKHFPVCLILTSLDSYPSPVTTLFLFSFSVTSEKVLSSLSKLCMVTLPGPCDCAQLLSCVQLFVTPQV